MTMRLAEYSAPDRVLTAGPSTAWQVALLALVATLLHAGLEVAGRGAMLAVTLGDADDAARLVQVRAFLNGAGWYDLATSRFGLDDGLLSHWSRLIDAGVVALIRLFGLFQAPEAAEMSARLVWPLLLFFPMAALVAYAALRQGGMAAAGLSLLVLLMTVSALHPFSVGRIDHHNVMIIGATGAALLLPLSLADGRLAVPAGLLAALSLTIGYEGLALIILSYAVMVLAGLVRTDVLQPAARAALATATGLVVGWLLSVPPARWMEVRCDALSLNLVVGGVVGAIALMAASRIRAVLLRLVLLATGGGMALLVFRTLNPVCMAGPFAEVDPAIGPIWLDSVRETYSIIRLFSLAPDVALIFGAFAAVSLLSAVVLFRMAGPEARSSAAVQLAILASAVALACWQLKLMPYASVLAVVPVAMLAARLMQRPAYGSIAGAGLVLLSSQIMLGALLMPLAERFRAPSAAVDDEVCRETASFAALAALPPGRMAIDVNVASHLVALTPHSALAAPYHRLSRGILANHALWSEADMSRLEGQLRTAGVRYVALCSAHAVVGAKLANGSLLARLAKADAPAVLVPVVTEGPIRVWRVNR